MALSRRAFVRTLGVGAVGGALSGRFIAARGREALSGRLGPIWPLDPIADLHAATTTAIRLNSNENPNGAGPAALEAIRGALGDVSRYPGGSAQQLQETIAAFYRVSPDHVVLGCGSGEILKMAVYALTSSTRSLVTAVPTFEDPTEYARDRKVPVFEVPVDADLKLNLTGMQAKVAGAGLVYLCNPNNPTATVHGAATMKDFVARVLKSSPRATVLIDEAYYDYVDDPSYATSIPIAMDTPRVIVARTFSKVYGMAGLRIGYAIGQPAALKPLVRYKMDDAINLMASTAAVASLGDRAHVAQEQTLNREAKEFTRRAFEDAGYKVTRSETNFMMVDVRRDSREFAAACRVHNVLVGRPFPPLTTHARISIGTLDEMRQAVDVFRKVLATSGTSAGHQ